MLPPTRSRCRRIVVGPGGKRAMASSLPTGIFHKKPAPRSRQNRRRSIASSAPRRRGVIFRRRSRAEPPMFRTCACPACSWPRGAAVELRRQARCQPGAVRAMPGVVAVVINGDFLGVIAEREEQAIDARAALAKSAKWRRHGNAGSRPADSRSDERRSQDKVINEKKAEAPAVTKTIEATYTRPYHAHASIGPSCAIAQFKDGKLLVALAGRLSLAPTSRRRSRCRRRPSL